MVLDQLGIIVFGVAAIWLVGLKDPKLMRWGYVCGILSEPFWLWSTWQAEQWGIFALAIFYTVSWINGLRNHFFKDNLPVVG